MCVYVCVYHSLINSLYCKWFHSYVQLELFWVKHISVPHYWESSFFKHSRRRSVSKTLNFTIVCISHSSLQFDCETTFSFWQDTIQWNILCFKTISGFIKYNFVDFVLVALSNYQTQMVWSSSTEHQCLPMERGRKGMR